MGSPSGQQQSLSGEGPHPTALILHPVTVAALGLMVINDAWLRLAHPGPVTGKLSDAAALVAYPGVLAAMWGAFAHLRRGLLAVLGQPSGGRPALTPRVIWAASLLPAVVLAAINLSGAARSGYLALLEAVDVLAVAGPLGYTPDPSDLWTLPAALLPVALGYRMLARHARGAGGHPPLSAGARDR